VLREVVQPVGIMWLDGEIVIHIIEPAEGFMGYLVECHFLKALCEEVGDNREQW
jgi:hypothetical protein